MISSSRSQIETRHKCWKERFLAYHKNKTGITKRGSKYEAAFGVILHDWMNCILTLVKDTNVSAEVYIHSYFTSHQKDFNKEITKAISDAYPNIPRDQWAHMVDEQQALLGFLVFGWVQKRLPRILREYEIIDVERETEAIFEPAKYLPEGLAAVMQPLRLPIRFDCVLKQKSTGLLFIMDFKTTKNANEDWNINLDNSLQSNLYIEAAEIIYKEHCGGIFYEGLVKGYRQVDNAKSSKFRGTLIQYGSALYGWRNMKTGEVGVKYVTGYQREYLALGKTTGEFYGYLADLNVDTEEYFPNTVPYKPLNIPMIVAQTIVNENNYANTLEMYNEFPPAHPQKDMYEEILFEKSLGNCFKYGTKHPCQFVDICHGCLGEEEIAIQFEPREDHHKREG